MPSLRLGHEEAHLDVAGRQQVDDRRARRHPLALDEERVVHERVLRRALRLLRQPPVGLRERGARGGDLGLGGADLVGARGEPRGRELRSQLRDPRAVALERWLRASSSRSREMKFCADELFLALEVRLARA